MKNTSCVLSAGALAELLEACGKDQVVPYKPTANFTIDLTDPAYSSLKNVGGVALASNVYIICTGTDSYIALSRVCTHQGCSVNYNSTGKNFVCPCHGGVYNINGDVVSGPPPSPLAQYKVTVSGSTLSVA